MNQWFLGRVTFPEVDDLIAYRFAKNHQSISKGHASQMIYNGANGENVCFVPINEKLSKYKCQKLF